MDGKRLGAGFAISMQNGAICLPAAGSALAWELQQPGWVRGRDGPEKPPWPLSTPLAAPFPYGTGG